MGSKKYMRFQPREYEDRYKRIQQQIKEKELDALMINDGTNFTYFSGMAPDFSYTRPTTMIIPKDGPPVVIIQRFTEESRKRETWVEDVRIYEKPTGLPITMVKEAFQELQLTKGKVGAELGFEVRLGMSYNDFIGLKAALPALKFIDAADIIWNVRIIKSKEEIKRLKKAGQITAKAYNKTFNTIGAGMTEIDVVDIFFEAHREFGGDSPWAMINSGPYNYNLISGGPANYKLKKGNMLWMDGGCTYQAYWSDYSRMASIGPPSEKQRKTYNLILKVTKAGVDAVRPGVTAAEISSICYDEAKKAGYDITFVAGRIGHGFGFMFTEPPHIAPYDHTIFKPGMTITVEPGFVTDHGCYHVEENLLVTKDGCEILSKASRKLKIIPT